MHLLSDKLLFHPNNFGAFLDDFIKSFRMHRGVCAVTNQSWHWLLQKTLKWFLVNEENIGRGCVRCGECLIFSLLWTACLMIQRSVPPTNRRSKISKRAFNGSRTPSSNVSRIGPVIFWPVVIPPEYIDLLSERRPEAVAILSHFGALLHQHCEMWMFGDSGVHLYLLPINT
jgi:hypothetical protein